MKAKPDTFVYTYADSTGAWHELTGTSALKHLCDFMKAVDKSYGLPPKDVSLHSLHSSVAMAMYLHGVPVYTIMLTSESRSWSPAATSHAR